MQERGSLRWRDFGAQRAIELDRNSAYNVQTRQRCQINPETNQITAELPGTTVITASVARSGSSAGYFSTCPPASICISLNGKTTGTVTQGVTQNLVTTVTDTNGHAITGLTLDYQSTNPLDLDGSRQVEYWRISRGRRRCTRSASRLRAIRRRSISVWYEWHRIVDLQQSGGPHGSRYREHFCLVWSAGQVAIFRSSGIAHGDSWIDGAIAVCAELDGDGPDRDHPVLRFTA